MNRADVTLCIPAWQAEAFIARTLQCASGQTHPALRILVSIDHSDDATEAICREAARDDPRIEVTAQKERLGWSENVNALLRRVDTPYFFLYFHDDLIEPTYTATLLQALRNDPQAASAHCDLEKFDLQQRIETGTDYVGTAATRLITYLTEEVKGPLLRGLIRSDVIGEGLCFPTIGGNGNWRVPPFAMRLLAAGPSRYVPQVLYRRWMREGSMTTTWQPGSEAELIAGQAECIRICLEIIDGIDAPDEIKDVVRFCLFVRMMIRTRRAEKTLGGERPIEPASVSPAFAAIDVPAALSSLAPPLVDAVLHAYAELLLLDGRHALRHQRFDEAWPQLAAAAALDPTGAAARIELARLLERTENREPAAALAHQVRRLRPELIEPQRMLARRARSGATSR